MAIQFNQKNVIPILKAGVWLAGLICGTFGLVLPTNECDMYHSTLVAILSGYGIILFESFVTFYDISLRESTLVFKAKVFLIMAIVVFHFATTFPLAFMLYFSNNLSNNAFIIWVSALIVYIALYKFFIEYIDKNIDVWTVKIKIYTLNSIMG